MRIVPCMLAPVLACSLTAGCVRVTEVREFSWEAVPGCVLDLSTFNGDVTVVGGADGMITATVTISATGDSASLSRVEVAVVEGRESSVTVGRTDGVHNPAASIEVSVPSSVRVGTVTTSNGDIRLDRTGGDMTLSTSNGDITATDCTGTVAASSSNGSVTLAGGSLGISSVSTSNGNIRADAAAFLQPASVETSNGSITLGLLEGCGAVLSLSTSNGSTTVEGEGFTVVETGRSGGSAVFGGGGAAVELNTSNGSISLRSGPLGG